MNQRSSTIILCLLIFSMLLTACGTAPQLQPTATSSPSPTSTNALSPTPTAMATSTSTPQPTVAPTTTPTPQPELVINQQTIIYNTADNTGGELMTLPKDVKVQVVGKFGDFVKVQVAVGKQVQTGFVRASILNLKDLPVDLPVLTADQVPPLNHIIRSNALFTNLSSRYRQDSIGKIAVSSANTTPSIHISMSVDAQGSSDNPSSGLIIRNGLNFSGELPRAIAIVYQGNQWIVFSGAGSNPLETVTHFKTGGLQADLTVSLSSDGRSITISYKNSQGETKVLNSYLGMSFFETPISSIQLQAQTAPNGAKLTVQDLSWLSPPSGKWIEPSQVVTKPPVGSTPGATPAVETPPVVDTSTDLSTRYEDGRTLGASNVTQFDGAVKHYNGRNQVGLSGINQHDQAYADHGFVIGRITQINGSIITVYTGKYGYKTVNVASTTFRYAKYNYALGMSWDNIIPIGGSIKNLRAGNAEGSVGLGDQVWLIIDQTYSNIAEQPKLDAYLNSTDTLAVIVLIFGQ